jgi:protein gp37
LRFVPKIGDPGMEGAAKLDGPEGMDTMLELEKPYRDNSGKINNYPMGFAPTLHRYRLGEPEKMTKPRTIFVGSMCDLFGDWVPVDWDEKVFEASEAAPQHRYLFLTKNPKGIDAAIDNIACEDRGSEDCYSYFEHFWFGTTVTCQKDLSRKIELEKLEEGHRFLSIEPLLERIDIDFERERCPVCGSREIYEERLLIPVPQVYCECCGEWEADSVAEAKPSIDWVIIGAESGGRKNKVVPQREWIENIVTQC